MKKASNTKTNERNESMTDKQYLNHLYEILTIAKKSNSLDDFINEFQTMISKYEE